MMPNDLRILELEKQLKNKCTEIAQLREQNDLLLKSNNKLKNDVHKFEDLVYSSQSLIAIFKGKDHVIDVANDSSIEIWGKGADVIGKPLLSVLPELHNQGIKELLDNVYKTGKAYHAREVPVELLIHGKPEIRYFDFTYQPHRDINGEIIGVADIATDVTQKALLNKKVKKSEREFRKLVNFMPHKISLKDREGNSVYYNQNWLSYLDKTLEELLDSSNLDLLHPNEVDRVTKELQECITSGNNLDSEFRIKDKNGNFQWHLTKATPILDENGQITSWITSSTEIQKLKDEEKRKEDFLKLISHELKTPVTSIKGYVQLLLAVLPGEISESTNKQKFEPYLHRIETQVEKLIRLLSEMLDMSRIEQNELDLRIENFSLNKHVEEIVEDLTYVSKDVQIELNHLYECRVDADRDRIGQVIINFVNNAIKYSPENKRVQISINQYDSDTVAVTVKDFGIGIEEKEQQQIFKRFYRVSGNKDDTYAGFGIGLYLSNEIIKRHQGHIDVNSEVGHGSEFTFTLPLNRT